MKAKVKRRTWNSKYNLWEWYLGSVWVSEEIYCDYRRIIFDNWIPKTKAPTRK